MPISRFLFFSSKHRFRQPLNLIRRFDLSKRTQSCSYTKSSRQSHRNPADYFLSPQETKASRSWSTYVIPAGGLLGLAGIATFVHYNDERRAVRKDSKKNLKILPIFVTIDPQRDTPAHLRAYLKEFNSRIVGLTGPVGAIRQMAQEYRVFFKKVEEEGDDYLVESSHNMYLMNPSLEVVRCFGVEYTAEELAEEISKEMKKAST
ncbi:protein SCO1 [Citrus sinensis]|uniref:Protein SCO1 n=1 Tax=Citrus sinensis TaxID=2711 RepID=A0ACB8JM81_CITSI|nr:protein SCO1 [Citrus sinensis]